LQHEPIRQRDNAAMESFFSSLKAKRTASGVTRRSDTSSGKHVHDQRLSGE